MAFHGLEQKVERRIKDIQDIDNKANEVIKMLEESKAKI